MPDPPFTLLLRFLGEWTHKITLAQLTQLLVLSYLGNLIYTLNKAQDPDIINKLIFIAFGYLGLLGCHAVVFISRYRHLDAEQRKTLHPPSFNVVYLATIPVFLTLLAVPIGEKQFHMLCMNLSLMFMSVDLPVIPKYIVSLTVFHQFDSVSSMQFKLAIPLLHIVCQYICHFYVKKSLTSVELNLFITGFINLAVGTDENSSVEARILSRLVICYILVLLLFTPVKFVFNVNPFLGPKIYLSVVMHIGFPVCFYFLSDWQVSELFGEYEMNGSVRWLLSWLNESRLETLKNWLIVSVIAVPLIFYFQNRFPLDVKRKVWHFFLFGMITGPFQKDPDLVKLAMIGVLGLFTLLETLRATKLMPFGWLLNQFFMPFQDYKDSIGPIAVSYIYLSLGVLLPLLLFDSISGLIVLGLGDSFASLIGKRCGLLCWSGSTKTMEGTAAFVAATTLGIWYYQKLSLADAFTCALFGGLIEAMSVMNDNVLVPLIVSMLVRCIECIRKV